MLFDSHAHYNDSRFDEDRFELLDKMVCSVPIYELYCNMLPEAAQVAYDGMKKPE